MVAGDWQSKIKLMGFHTEFINNCEKEKKRSFVLPEKFLHPIALLNMAKLRTGTFLPMEISCIIGQLLRKLFRVIWSIQPSEMSLFR